MMKVLLWAACAAIGYLLGSVSSGVIVSKLYGNIDIRKEGSGNVGMTNVMRTLGWVPSFITFAGDALKGVLAAWLGSILAGDTGLCIAGIAAIAGHNWPLFFNFKGGKGMSTSFGFVLMADWRIALILLGVQAIVVVSSGYMSVASLATACLLPILTFLIPGHSVILKVCVCLLSALAIFSHRSNVKRLAEGNENRLDAQKITKVSEKMVNNLKNRRNNGK